MPDSEPNDMDLVRACLGGDEEAMDILVARHERALMGYLRGKTNSLEEARDAFQETWLRVLRHLHRFRRGSFKAWLTTIARNFLIDESRRRRPTVSIDASTPDHFSWGERLAGDVASPDAGLLAADVRERIQESVRSLPPDQREVFLLRTQQDLSFAEIAKLLNIPLNTALGRMHYAVVKLREQLEDLL